MKHFVKNPHLKSLLLRTIELLERSEYLKNLVEIQLN